MKQDEMIMIPWVLHEGDMAREERKQARLLFLIAGILGAILCQEFISAKKTNK